MAIYHCNVKPISRSSGRSAVAAAAYRTGTRIENERDGLSHDYRRRRGVAHCQIMLPEGSDIKWARNRSALWNAAEVAEKRKDSRVAREIEVALPHELEASERIELVQSFAQNMADRYGVAVDFAIHAPHGKTDKRNHHAHLLMTTRTVGVGGLSDKTNIEREDRWLKENGLPSGQAQVRDIRQSWSRLANDHLARAGQDSRIDHRSHRDRGIEIEPTRHVGVHATQMARRGIDVSRTRLSDRAARRNAALVQRKPEQVLTLVASEKPVFGWRDVARYLRRCLGAIVNFKGIFAAVMASSAIVKLWTGRNEAANLYTTKTLFALESRLVDRAMAKIEAIGAADVEAKTKPISLKRRLVPMTDFEKAVDAYACALAARDRAIRGGVATPEREHDAAWRAAKALDHADPQARNIFHSALRNDKQMLKAFWDLSGRARMAALIEGMDNERALLTDPSVRAERYLSEYRNLEKVREFLLDEGRRTQNVEKQMSHILTLVRRDPEVAEAIRKRELEGKNHQNEQGTGGVVDLGTNQEPNPGPGFGW